jgi:CPA2 family monovalent cation:H+ antiporter-2
MIGRALERRGFTFVVISQQRREVEHLRARGVHALYGEASNIELLEQAHIESARLVIVASADPQATHLIVDRARVLNPSADFVVRTGSDEESGQLRALSPRVQAVHSQRELAVQMARYSLRRFGVNAAEAEAIAQGLRGRPFAPPTAAPPSRLDRIRARFTRRAPVRGPRRGRGRAGVEAEA